MTCERMAHHPMLQNPAGITTDQELIASGNRANQACQMANRGAERALHGSGQVLAGLLAWAWGLLP